jgi:hypothetical protein
MVISFLFAFDNLTLEATFLEINSKSTACSREFLIISNIFFTVELLNPSSLKLLVKVWTTEILNGYTELYKSKQDAAHEVFDKAMKILLIQNN